jgi:antitoxin Phd
MKPAARTKSTLPRRIEIAHSRVTHRLKRALERQSSYTATEAKNEFGRLLEQAIHGKPVIITKHGSPRAVLMSFDEFNALKQAPEAKLNDLSLEFDQLLEGMQTAKARRAVDRLFRMTPAALGRAAVTGARKRG